MAKFPQANKSFGQHFLTSSSVIQKITTLPATDCDAIIEVGPGPAVLTPHLALHQRPLFVIEMDERFVDILTPIVGQDHVFREDALKFHWDLFLQSHKFLNVWLVSNLPYNISVPLTISFLKIPQIKNMTLMYQKEVAEKILPRNLKNSMSSLQVLIQTQFDVEHVTYAPPGAFLPPPKVDSQVLHFKRKKAPLISLEEIDRFEFYLRLIFGQRRKQLSGILNKSWGKEKTLKYLTQAGLAPEIRAEALNLKQVINLYEISHHPSI